MATPLSSTITTLLSSPYSDRDLRDALHTLESTHGLAHNTPAARRNLRLNVQRDILDANAHILHDFGHVAAQLRSVGTALAQLQAHCASLHRDVAAARVETAPMLDEAATLLDQRTRTAHKQTLLEACSAHFVLTPDEHSLLTAAAEPVDAAFFATLVKAKRIQRDSQVLLAAEHERLGREVLDTTRRALDAAFDKLFRWTQREFRALDLENPSVSATVRRALRVLAEKPPLFQACLDAFADAREAALKDAFYAALTGGAGQQPIDFSAHEPLRYAGDMLAWAHATTVSEREALEALFVAGGDEIARSIQQGLESEPWLRPDDDDDDKPAAEQFDGRRALAQLIDRSMTGVVALLHTRITSLAATHAQPGLAYKLANLVTFYRSVLARLVLPDAALLDALANLSAACLARFQAQADAAAAAVRAEHPTTDATDLDPPDFLDEALAALPDLLKSYDTHAAAADAAAGTDGAGARFLLAVALDPYLAICRAMSTALAPPAGDVFAVNCLLATRAALGTYGAAARPKLAELEAALDALRAQLTDQQLAFLRQESGLQGLVGVLAGGDDTNGDVRRAQASRLYAPDALAQVGAQLDAFLPAAVMDARERLRGCASRALVQAVTDAAAARFCDEFERVERVVAALGGGREAVWVRSGDEVRVLLG